MSTAAKPAGGSRGERAAARVQGDVTPGELAWLLVVPTALVILAAIVLVGPPLGSALFAPPHLRFWPIAVAATAPIPEPTEHARYLLALLGPVLAGGAVLVLARRSWTAQPRIAKLVQAAQALTLTFAVGMVLAQHLSAYNALHIPTPRSYFTWTTLGVAALATALAVVALQRQAVVAWLAGIARETPRRRIAGLVIAIGFSAAWLLSAFNTEGSIGNANRAVSINVPFWLAEPFAVLNGHPPLVDFHSQYGQLWPYAIAGVMSIFGTSFTVYSSMMVLATGCALIAVYAVLRRVTERSIVALALFLPFVATSFFLELGPLDNPYTPATLYSIFPGRYAGPFLLAWLAARHLDGARPRRPTVIFLAAGIVALNNPEFGIPAFGATFATLVLLARPPSRAVVLRLIGEAIAGIAGAVVLVVALTLAVAGALPRFGLLFEFSRLYGAAGFGMLPMPTLGFHLAIYATFAAAIVVATVRIASNEHGRALTGVLLWSGVFGLGAGGYFVGRSHQEVLINLFSAWALALALLLVVVIRATLARPSRRPAIAELAVLFGFAIAACSLAQMPTPWSQIDRIATTTRIPKFPDAAMQRFIAQRTTRGEHVALFIPLGQRIAYNLGLDDAMPYAHLASMPTREHMDTALRAFDDAGVRSLFISIETLVEERTLLALARAGFRIVKVNPSPQIAHMVR